MEKFELTIAAQGSQSIWVVLTVIALLCVTAVCVTYLFCTKYRVPSQKER